MVGENELCDITLTEDFSHDEVKARLEKAFTHEIEIKEVFDPGLKMGKVKSAEYVLVFENLTAGKEELEKALSDLAPVMKTTKSGKERELDIKSMVYGSSVEEDGGKTVLNLCLAASGDSYLNPDLVLVSMRNSGLNIPDEYDITRTNIFFETK